MNNYFKVVIPHLHTPDTFFPFDDENLISTRLAWFEASKIGSKVAIYRQPENDGPWRSLSLVGADIDGSAFAAFANGNFADDGDEEYAN